MIAKLVSSLEKVFLDQEPADAPGLRPEGFANETISFQLAYCQPDNGLRGDTFCELRVESDIAAHVRLRRVVSVPVGLAIYTDADDDYLRREAGLYPDMLVDVSRCRLRALPGQWNSVWVDVEGAPAGEHDIALILSRAGQDEARVSIKVNVLAAELPPRRS